jgi:hypothetical protein
MDSAIKMVEKSKGARMRGFFYIIRKRGVISTQQMLVCSVKLNS